MKKLLHDNNIKTYDRVLFCAAFLFAFLFMSHPDLWETANHSYVFLESIFSGNGLNFYEFCARHNNTYYYLNDANYNIIVYLIFGLWELPVFAFNHIFGLAMNESFIIYWAKIVSAAFYIGCGYAVRNIALEMKLSQSDSGAAALFFLFSPIAFYSPMAMGQYDTLCLFFTLTAVVYWMRGDMKKFSLFIGAGVVCKFFALLVFIPLLLLHEKKILNILKYGILSLWLYIPTTLLYFGRTGNSRAFTKRMIERVFALTYDTGFSAASVYLTLYALIVFFAWLYNPDEKDRNYTAMWLCMTVFGALFVCIYWHPQWVILMTPFIVLTTFAQKNRFPFFCLDIIMRAGYFITCYTYFPNQTGANLFTGGILTHVFGIGLGAEWQPISHFIGLIPYVTTLMPVMFAAPVMADIVFKVRIKGKSLADRLTDGADYDRIPLKVCGYGIFLIGFVCMWLAPSLLELINSYGII